jgi:hypothetical protein
LVKVSHCKKAIIITDCNADMTKAPKAVNCKV